MREERYKKNIFLLFLPVHPPLPWLQWLQLGIVPVIEPLALGISSASAPTPTPLPQPSSYYLLPSPFPPLFDSLKNLNFSSFTTSSPLVRCLPVHNYLQDACSFDISRSGCQPSSSTYYDLQHCHRFRHFSCRLSSRLSSSLTLFYFSLLAFFRRRQPSQAQLWSSH